ncbi:MAG: hypothetical protein KC777_27490 [Cyanobacteria bacterium HKST-UBA02]|nr:hypothetical protein [Cyanobacteria bacterium HKST-UBA02]
MDIVFVILVAALLMGIFGWSAIPLTHCVPWAVSWWDEDEVNWGEKFALVVLMPFAWLYVSSIFLILYF